MLSNNGCLLQFAEITTISAEMRGATSEMVSKGQSMTSTSKENPNIIKLVSLTSDVVNQQSKISYN